MVVVLAAAEAVLGLGTSGGAGVGEIAFARLRREWADPMERLEAHARQMYNKYNWSFPAPARMGRRGVGIMMGNIDLDMAYFGTIGMGSPEQDVSVILDTGSADLIVAGDGCGPANGCAADVAKYTLAGSSTGRSVNKTFEIKYGSGSARGQLVEDSVRIGSITVQNQAFADCSVLDNIVDEHVSGILGLGWQSIASSGRAPPVLQMYRNGALDEPVLGFAFSRFTNDTGALAAGRGAVMPGGVMTVGGLNSSYFEAEPSYVPLSETDYWRIPLDRVRVNGADLGLSATVAIDTGTSLIGVPPAVARQIYSAIPGSGTYKGVYHTFPCDTEITVGFTFGGIEYTIDPIDFNTGATSGSGQTCVGAIFDVPGETMWIVGDTFLKNVYSAFRFDPPAVGFAPLRTSAAAVMAANPLPENTPVAAGGTIVSAAGANAGSSATSVGNSAAADRRTHAAAPALAAAAWAAGLALYI